MSKLRVAPDLALPMQAVTETFSVLGKRGTGKTYTAGVLAEEMIKAGHHVVIIDPTDTWWGLRSSKDGKGPGLPVVIFGGPHGDLPLLEQDAEILARAIVEQSITCVLSIRHLKKRARNRFLAPFLEELYHLKAERRDPLHLVIDEADRVAPQKLMKGEEQERMLGAIDEIVRMGRSSGFGVTLITQRSAVISKDVLSQTEVLITTRTISPQDIAAVDAWIQEHDVEDKRDEFVASLPSLPAGDSWWWSPGWLGLFKHTRVREKETFDSSYTPKPGEKPRAPKGTADVDLVALKTQLAKTIEREQARDPAHLQKRIRELEAEAKTRAATVGAEDRKTLTEKLRAGEGRVRQLEKDLLAVAKRAAEDRQGIEALVKRHLQTVVRDIRKQNEQLAQSLKSSVAKLQRSLAGVQREIAAADEALKVIADLQVVEVELPPLALGAPDPAPETRISERSVDIPVRREATRAAPRARTPAPRADGDSPPLGRGEQRILDAMAELEALGLRPVTRAQAGAIAGYTLNGGTGGNYVGSLVSRGLLAIPVAGQLELTEEGHAAAAPVEAPLTNDETQRRALEKLGGGERRILEHLISIWPAAQSRAEVGEAVNYTLNGGTGGNYVGRLTTLQFVEIPGKGMIRAADILFPEDAAVGNRR